MSSGTVLGRELPDSWELLTIGDVSSIVGGSTPKSKEPSYWGGDIPWLGVADLTGYSEKRISHGERNITQAGFDSCPAQMLPSGSVVFSSRAPIGYVAIADNPLCTSQGFKSLVLPDSLNPDFVYWWMKTSKPLVEALASGTTFKEISGKGMAQVPFPLPPRAEQDRIVAAVESAMDAIRDIEITLSQIDGLCGTQRLGRIEGLRRSILHRAFTGQLVPQDPGDEPASELLERIKAEKAEREAELKAAKSRKRKQRAAANKNASPTSTTTASGAG